MAQRIIIQTGGVGGGRMECDGRRHFWLVPNKALGIREKTPCGRCPNADACRQRAAVLEKQAREEAEKTAAAQAPEKKG